MHILQLPTNFRTGGIQRHVLDLSAYLVTKGHQVTFSGDGGAWVPDGPDYEPLPLNSVAEYGGSTSRRVASLLRMAVRLRRILRQRRIDLIHTHETAPLLVARLAAVGLGLPVVFTFHGSAPGREREVARFARLAATVTLSPSRTSLDRLIAHGLPAGRTRQLGLGIAPVPPLDAAAVGALRADLLGDGGQVLVLSLSRLQEQKGIDIMVEVARRVVAVRPDVRFALAGGGPLTDEVPGWLAKAGIADRFRLLGPVSTVPMHLAASDLFLLTSRWEALPISIVEAFRAGLPVIATDCGGVHELVDDRVGRLEKVGDAAGLAAAILEMVDRPDLRAEKSVAALTKSCETRFDPDTVHAGFEALYRDLAGKPG